MLCNDFIDNTNGQAMPLTKQLTKDYEKPFASTISVMPVPHEGVSAYGVIVSNSDRENGLNGVDIVDIFVEKCKS